jgi:hypothetical protein
LEEEWETVWEKADKEEAEITEGALVRADFAFVPNAAPRFRTNEV